jgi:hypothetical protein
LTSVFFCEEILRFSTNKNSSPEVIEGIFGEEFGPPENPRFNETLKFFPPILGVIRTNIYPCGRIVFHSLKHMAQKISYADSKCNQKLSEN